MDSLTADQRLSCSSAGAAREELRASKVVLEADDVVFAEIRAALDFDKNQIFFTGIFDAMSGADGNVDGFTSAYGDLAAVECDLRGAGDYDPVFGSLRMLLITQALSGQHLDSFDLESGCFLEDGVSTPRPLIKFSHCFCSSGSFNHKKAVRG